MMRNIDYKHLVDKIRNLRLVKNTRKEWETYLMETGFKITALDYEAIWLKMSQWSYDRWEIDLHDLLIEYAIFNKENYTDCTARHKAVINETSVKELLKCYLTDYESDLRHIDKAMDEVDLKNYDLSLLYLVVTKYIPSYTNTSYPDMSQDKLVEQYVSLKTVVEELYTLLCRQESLTRVYDVKIHEHPYLRRIIAQMEERIEKRELIRLDLIAFFMNAVNNLYANSHKEALYEANIAIRDNKVAINDIHNNCIWTKEGKTLEDSDFLWEFEQIGMDYYLYKFDRKIDMNYTKYTLIFFEQKNQIHFYALHPKANKYTFEGVPVSSELFSLGIVEIDKEARPLKLSFTCDNTSLSGFPSQLTLQRNSLEGKKSTKWFNSQKNRISSLKNRYPQYEYKELGNECLFSKEYIFIEKDREIIDEKHKIYRITSWYQIYRYAQGLSLEQMSFDNLIMRTRFGEKEYLSFVEANTFIDVTDDVARSKYDITIKHNPTVFSVPDDMFARSIKSHSEGDCKTTITTLFSSENEEDTFQLKEEEEHYLSNLANKSNNYVETITNIVSGKSLKS